MQRTIELSSQTFIRYKASLRLITSQQFNLLSGVNQGCGPYYLIPGEEPWLTPQRRLNDLLQQSQQSQKKK